MKDGSGKILDVGKAVDLRRRPRVAERTKIGGVDVLYVKGGALLTAEVHRGAIVGLGPIVPVEETVDGLREHLHRAYRAGSPDRLVAGGTDRTRIEHDDPIHAPRPSRSDAGRLLKACRTHHAHRTEPA
jgi:hypothetical protein